VEHPHPAEARMERIADAEEAIRCLQELGWRLERMSSIDEPGEPLRIVIRIAWETPAPFDGIL
jgi:hypothetical protein